MTTFQANSTRYTKDYIIRQRQRSIFQTMTLQLLMLSAFAEIFSDLFLFQIGGFPVTLPHLLLVIATGIALLTNQGGNLYFALILLAMVMIELLHAIAVGYVMDTEWHKSLAQFLMYGFCFVVLAKSKSTRETLVGLTPWLLKLAIIISALGIVQFLLLQLGIPAFLPELWRIRSDFDPMATTFRYGGFTPAIGLATEPARFAVGLVAILACLLFLDNLIVIQNRRLHRTALGLLLCAVIVSFSITGILMTIALLGLSILIRARKNLALVIVIGVIVLVAAGGELIAPIQTRIQSVLQGSDNSAQIRVVASIRLLFAPPIRIETFMLGTGLGMENRDLETYLRTYTDASLRLSSVDGIRIHNILATMKFLQGWVGVVLYLILLWGILQPMIFNFRLYYPLIAFLILYHFATGYYLAPTFWSLLALFTVLSNALPKEQRIKKFNTASSLQVASIA